MSVSRNTKIIVGIGTLISTAFPIVLLATIFVARVAPGLIGSTFTSESARETILYLYTHASIPIAFARAYQLIYFATFAFDFAHLVKNTAGSDTIRIVLAIGLAGASYLVMPIYYLLYILPGKPPKWAMKSEVLKGTEQPQ